MSKILIISDTHYLRRPDLREFIESFDTVTTIHCGDIYPGYKSGDITNIYLCKGNNDYGNIAEMCRFTVDHIKFLTLHGHKGYAYNPHTLLNFLNEDDYDVICFGHTHVPYYYNDGKTIIINPGSLTLGRVFPRINSYVLFDTETKEVEFYNVKDHSRIEVKNSYEQ